MEQERYNRQVILHGFGQKAQSKLNQARVLVIGAGGLGCPALQYLATAGVGYLGLVDDDTVALSNLHRQVLYTNADIGKDKATVAAARLREMNPEIEIISHNLRINRGNILEIFKDYDVIFDGTDNFETRYLINDTCAMLKKPLVFAAVSGYEGQLAIFNASNENGMATNYRDLFPVQPATGEIANCAENGVLGVLPGVIGTMAANEIIKLITGIGKPLINKLLHYNLLTNDQYVLNISPGDGYQLPETPLDIQHWDDGNSCEKQTTYGEIDTDQLDRLRAQASVLLIDVRELHEVPKLEPETFKQIPMSTFNHYLQTEIQEKNIVLICQHGIRSIAAAEALSEKYAGTKNIYSLKGGIVKWRNYFS
jgi:molybdopterin/thiamine biosynthesis adenylyltransferase/rhodanese-related sulfurtransferase